MIFSIVPLATGMYRACALIRGTEYMVFGFSHTDALRNLFLSLKKIGVVMHTRPADN